MTLSLSSRATRQSRWQSIIPTKLLQMEGELARWAETPVPLLFFRSLQRLELQGDGISKSPAERGPAPGSHRSLAYFRP